MEKIFPSIYRVLPSKVTPTKYISLFVVLKTGNLLFPCFAKGGTISSSFEAIEAMGGIKIQLLGDMHHKAKHCDEVYERFSALTYCSTVEGPDVRKSVSKYRTFPFERHMLDPQTEVIPTPGHRPGSCCYLVDVDGKRVLFAGDNVWFDGKRWTAFPSRQGRADLRRSLQVLARSEFTTLIVNSLVTEEVCSIEFTSGRERENFFAAVSATLEPQ